MSSWLAVIVFTILASCAIVVVAGYFRGNRKLQTAAGADPAHAPVTAAAPIQPERDEKPAHTDSWIWH
jgi:hypothetical protein